MSSPLHSPAAERNKQPILEAMRALLPAEGRALEIASGTGQHVQHFAASLPGWRWQPSDAEAASLASIAAWTALLPADLQARVHTPVQLDVLSKTWPLETQAFELIYCANMLHIAPWACCEALMQGAARHLVPGGLLLTYGPYLEAGVETAPSNLAFDADLRRRHPDWGLRSLDAVRAEAQTAGLRLQQRIALPANNLLLAWQLPASA